MIREKDALAYHREGRRGKIEVVPTKPVATQRDLSLAYSPGVAEPARAIHADPRAVDLYTARRNLVAVVTNGTAVLGLGDVGPLAAKPVVRLRDCLAHPHVVPTAPIGVRHLLDLATQRMSEGLKPVVECDSFELARHYVLEEGAIGFQIPIGLKPEDAGDLAMRRVSERDVAAGHLLLGQMRRRVLPVASARFAVQLTTALAEMETMLLTQGTPAN